MIFMRKAMSRDLNYSSLTDPFAICMGREYFIMRPGETKCMSGPSYSRPNRPAPSRVTVCNYYYFSIQECWEVNLFMNLSL